MGQGFCETLGAFVPPKRFQTDLPSLSRQFVCESCCTHHERKTVPWCALGEQERPVTYHVCRVDDGRSRLVIGNVRRARVAAW
eukprot:scaffold125173_cov30-Tisochrysis_lutea.AAC.2